MLDHGADVNGRDPYGRTPLMYAAIFDDLPVEAVQLLIARGADVNARDNHPKAGDAGLTVVDIALQNGDTHVSRALQEPEDGSWFTKTRALAFPPYFEAGFPHGYDQWMSAAGISWAAMALTLALPEQSPMAANR